MRRKLAGWIQSKLLERFQNVPCPYIVGPLECPSIYRWFVIPRNKFFNIYFHYIVQSDTDPALHDHPWWNLSFILEGEYTEHTILKGGVNVRKILKEGQLKFRGARYSHRIELHDGPCYTLFLTGPVVRQWGFHCKNGWRAFKDYQSARKQNGIYGGCD